MLLDKLITRKGNETQHALGWLVARQYLCETKGAGTDAIYHLNPEKLDKACELFAGSIPLGSKRDT